MLPTEKSNAVIHYYVHIAGAAISVILILLTFSHIMYHYIKIFHSGAKGKIIQNRTNYILFFLICITGLVPALSYAVIRSNLLTQQPAETFTKLQCKIGFFSLWTSFSIFNMLIYVILIHRIRIAFSDSIYRYHSCIYITMHTFVISVSIALIIIIWLPYQHTEYVLYYFDNKDYVYCGTITDPNHDDKSLNFVYLIGNALFVIGQILWDLIVLYMFTYRLYSLQQSLVAQHLLENRKYKESPQIKMVPPTPSVEAQPSPQSGAPTFQNITSDSNAQMNENDDDISALPKFKDSRKKRTLTVEDADNGKVGPRLSRKVTVEDIIDDSKAKGRGVNQSAERILTMHNLIKQHTILILFIVIASLIYMVMLIVGDGWYVTELVWPLNVNMICMWLMFGSANKYYEFSTKYCPCYLCYCYKKRDINARTCLFFC